MKKLLKLLKKLFSIGNKKNSIDELNFPQDSSKIGGYIHFYIKDGLTKSKFIPVELKDSFVEKFGHD